MHRRLAALAAFALAMVAGIAAPAAAQVPASATLTLVPTSTTPGGTAQATAVFEPPTTPGPLLVQISLTGGLIGGNATVATGSNTSELSNCAAGLNNTRVRCDWTPAGGGPQTLVVTINVDPAAAAPTQGQVQAFGGPSGGLVLRASALFVIVAEGPTTTTTTTLAPTTAPTTPTSATVAPTSAVVAPTSAAATTQAGSLPATGGSDASAFIALVVLALGAFLLIVARKFGDT